MNTESSLKQSNQSLPTFQILIVEDDPRFRAQFCKFIEDYGRPYYRLDIHEAATVEEGMVLLQEPTTALNFDGVILDLVLPLRSGQKEEKNMTLNHVCLELRNRIHWVAQVTSYPDDPDLKRFWDKFSKVPGFRYAVYGKKADDLLCLAQDMFFPEIKVPLGSDWLPEELGAVEVPIGRRNSYAPEGFNIYQFIHRLSAVWPALDQTTRSKAMTLFDIEPGDPQSNELKRIGFRVFSCWDQTTPT